MVLPPKLQQRREGLAEVAQEPQLHEWLRYEPPVHIIIIVSVEAVPKVLLGERLLYSTLAVITSAVLPAAPPFFLVSLGIVQAHRLAQREKKKEVEMKVYLMYEIRFGNTCVPQDRNKDICSV